MKVRATDIGYGHVKLTEGIDPDTNDVSALCFPAQSPIAPQRMINAEATQRRDTFLVPCDDQIYEVGRGINLALGAHHVSEVLDHDYPLSVAYKARLYGALNYMAPGLPSGVIDYLILGLPLTTYFKLSEPLAERFSGRHVINTRGLSITVSNCRVYPQPLGGYAYYLVKHAIQHGGTPRALIVDPGYNTIDWFVCQGMTASEDRSKAIHRGMSAVLREVAERMIRELGLDASVSEVVRYIDQARLSGSPLLLYGKPIDLAHYMSAGDHIVEEAIQAVKNSIGSGADIDTIVVTGGGASLYTTELRRKFPKHEIIELDEPNLANVRGFHYLGERLASSAARASGVREKVGV